MKLDTRLLGMVDYLEKDVIHFPNGLPSFEEETSFLMLPLMGGEDNLFCLQSLKNPDLCFILINPFSLDSQYAPKLKQEELNLLQVGKDEDLCFYVMCAMKRPVEKSTVNMKCPIAWNPDENIALQCILDDDHLHMRHSLAEFAKAKEESTC